MILRIRIHHKDRVLIFVGLKQKMERKKGSQKFFMSAKSAGLYLSHAVLYIMYADVTWHLNLYECILILSVISLIKCTDRKSVV